MRKSWVFVLMILGFCLDVPLAQAVKCSELGLVYSKTTKTCVKGKSKTKYKGKGNKNCKNTKPEPLNFDVFAKYNLQLGNDRAVYMNPEVLKYLIHLKKSCDGLVVESAYRDCDTNRKVRGKQKSRHLCGLAADTSGCPDRRSKKIPRKACEEVGMHFEDEGSKRFPHCQSKRECPQ